MPARATRATTTDIVGTTIRITPDITTAIVGTTIMTTIMITPDITTAIRGTTGITGTMTTGTAAAAERPRRERLTPLSWPNLGNPAPRDLRRLLRALRPQARFG